MKTIRSIKFFLYSLFLVYTGTSAMAQEIPISNYSKNAFGQVQLEVNSSIGNYYILKVRNDTTKGFELLSSLTLGEAGTTTITEPLGAYLIEHYQVLEYAINSPVDSDGDGIDDISEYTNIPDQNPINPAPSLNTSDGFIAIDSLTRFKELSFRKEHFQWSEFLNGKGFVKFLITDFKTASPKVYFINSNVYKLHSDFAAAVGLNYSLDSIQKGQISYHPSNVAENGTFGVFAFNYSNGHGRDFEIVQRTQELLAASMPFLRNNLSHYVTVNNRDEYERDSLLFQESRVPILFEEDVYADVDYWGLNQAEGFGFFRQMSLEELPSSRDIVFYESLPNEIPRISGIITSVLQTPLSHVNLRAVQNNIPNAFIRDALSVDSIAALLDNYIYFKAKQDGYVIRKASVEEVNDWFMSSRPLKEQSPPLNLSYTSILPLSKITFDMYDGFGAKCSNLATMKSWDFPDETIPDGYGVPFYFYREFMEYNNFFEEVRQIIGTPNFETDRLLRDSMLEDFRKKIKKAEMPTWIMDALQDMQSSFPNGTSIRCRSSTNNEDLPGFSGAGLYTSKTQHPIEGHISKSIKQVYASLWNLRAYDERVFHRVNHFNTCMGVLCHPNFEDEKANGVGVSSDPLYRSIDNYYLNTQVGEDLITNPNVASIPEEILLHKDTTGGRTYEIIRRSNLVSSDTLVMSESQLHLLRDYLTEIHDNFAVLYDAASNPSFAMDIEYKITSDNQLIIKQARPWPSYTPKKDASDNFEWSLFPNPAREYFCIECDDCSLNKVTVINLLGEHIQEFQIQNADLSSFQFSTTKFNPGLYFITITSENTGGSQSKILVKH